MSWLRSHLGLVLVGAASSLVLFIAGLLAVRWLVTRLPADYFCTHDARASRWAALHPAWRWSLLVLKNVLGLVLLGLGFTMLFTPGPGVLAILAGVTLMNFPGKRALELYIVSRPAVLGAINAARAKVGQPPLRLPE